MPDSGQLPTERCALLQDRMTFWCLQGVTLGASTPQQSATLPSKYSLSEDSEAAVPASTRSNTAHGEILLKPRLTESAGFVNSLCSC